MSGFRQAIGGASRGDSALQSYRDKFPRAHVRSDYVRFDDDDDERRCVDTLLAISDRGGLIFIALEVVERLVAWVYRCYADDRFKRAKRLRILMSEEVERYLQDRFPNYREMMHEMPTPSDLRAANSDVLNGTNGADIAINRAYTRMREEDPPEVFRIEIPCFCVIAQANDLESMAVKLGLNSDGRHELMELYKAMSGKSLAFDWYQTDRVHVKTNRTLEELQLFGKMALQGLEIVNDAMRREDGNVLNDESWIEKFEARLKDRLIKTKLALKQPEVLQLISIDDLAETVQKINALEQIRAACKIIDVAAVAASALFRDADRRSIGGPNAWLGSKLVVTRRRRADGFAVDDRGT